MAGLDSGVESRNSTGEQGSALHRQAAEILSSPPPAPYLIDKNCQENYKFAGGLIGGVLAGGGVLTGFILVPEGVVGLASALAIAPIMMGGEQLGKNLGEKLGAKMCEGLRPRPQ